ncbi:MAG TPA: DUF983 domain-containing protein [Pirellulales bacterium]|nr:DUF983 domain-containing protein [Pirellulales bacterium]
MRNLLPVNVLRKPTDCVKRLNVARKSAMLTPVSSEHRELEKTQLPFWRTVGRSCRLRCPRCGESKLFLGWFLMRPRCPTCDLNFLQEPGFYLGSIYFNYGLTALVVTIAYFAFYFGSSVSNDALLVGLTTYCVVFPLWFFRYARSLWLGFDQYWDPD